MKTFRTGSSLEVAIDGIRRHLTSSYVAKTYCIMLADESPRCLCGADAKNHGGELEESQPSATR